MSNTEENPEGNIIEDIENEAELGEPESGSDDETVTIIPVPEPEVSLQSRYDKKTVRKILAYYFRPKKVETVFLLSYF